MTVTLSTLLERWSTKSNRRRVVETIVRLAPWLVAGVVAVLLAFEWSVVAGVATAVVASVIAIAAIIVMARRVWHGPASIARELDHERHTADLLQTAYAIEGRGPKPDEPFEPVVLARAHAFVPSIAATAVAPLRFRTSAFGGLVAVGVIAVFVFVDMTPAPPSPMDAKTAAASHVLGERDKAKAKAVGDAIDALSKDKTLSPKVRERIERAKDALHRATLAKTGNAALAALSEASRELEEAAKQMGKSHAPEPSELAKMARQQLADEPAKMAKQGDQAQLSSLAREALRRSAMSPQEAKQLADAIKQAIAKQGGDPSGKPREGATGAEHRMQQLAAAADQLSRNDLAGAKSDMSDLARSTAGATQPRDARMSSLDNARRAVAQMHAAQRSAMNGQQTSDQRADAARAAAMAKAGPPKPGSGSGQPGVATAGMQPGMSPGAPQPGAAPNGTPQLGDAPPGGALSVLQGPNLPGNPGGAQGTSGSPGAKAPSGASDIETSAAEEVTTPPPVSPDGVIRAIREHSTGEHASEAFEPVRDHYQAIAEAAMHRDQIPLTRRDFIQRYFEALRDHGGRDEPAPLHPGERE